MLIDHVHPRFQGEKVVRWLCTRANELRLVDLLAVINLNAVGNESPVSLCLHVVDKDLDGVIDLVELRRLHFESKR